MNKKLGLYSIIVNTLALFVLAVSSLLQAGLIAGIAHIVFALSFVPVSAIYSMYGRKGLRVASDAGKLFAGMYATVGLAVIVFSFAELPPENDILLGFNLLVNGLLSLATLFLSLALKARTTAEKMLKWMLLLHGVIAIPSAFLINNFPFGLLLLELWCLYFIAINMLAYRYFSGQRG
ncbi:MAG: hypothetical protein LBE91_17940 [Tannerella sp.]|jgi:hypothetical protein|nr:hypothetical protein [Tannerella sp.]